MSCSSFERISLISFTSIYYHHKSKKDLVKCRSEKNYNFHLPTFSNTPLPNTSPIGFPGCALNKAINFFKKLGLLFLSRVGPTNPTLSLLHHST
jgi:hypothetical protein